MTVQTTQDTSIISMEGAIAELAKLLGSTQEETMKLLSDLDEYDIEELLFYIDIYNTYQYEFLKSYIFDLLKLDVSKSRLGRTGVESVAKAPFELNRESQTEKRRFMDFFRRDANR